ncbi:MAG: VCBS repeat-containing protein, partial [Candidatus Eremiobacteraeota bacterium]|nr:VCBS repeat-containing protein [Candidatus Eremiobacteraeota bacterium]
VATTIAAPTSTKASFLIADIDQDGYPELIVPDTDEALSTPENPITRWLVAENRGPAAYFSAPVVALSEDWPMVSSPSGPADPKVQPELGTSIDYDGDGKMDVLIHDVTDSNPNWTVLIAQPDHTFKQHDTGLRKPFPVGAQPAVPTLTAPGASAHLGDFNGDGQIDLLDCSNETSPDPTHPTWTLHVWRPSPMGFDVTGEVVQELRLLCDVELFTVDLLGDGKTALVVRGQLEAGGQSPVALATYQALERHADGHWESWDTALPTLNPGGHLVWLDANGDHLPDVIESGVGDGFLYTTPFRVTLLRTPQENMTKRPWRVRRIGRTRIDRI